MKYSSLLVIGFSFLVFFSCKKESTTPTVTPFAFVKPAHFPAPNYSFVGNQVTEDRFDLGKQLFYDPILSLNNTVSCAKCHDQAHGFSDHNIKFSNGVGGTLGERNSPALSNLAWYPNFMWDGGVNHIEILSVAPITNQLEMKETIANVVAKLNASTNYKTKFKKAYNIDVITDQYMLKALGQFMGMLVSSDSKYDRVYTGKATFTASEENGYTLFKTNCVSCHTEPLTTDFSFRNNGIDNQFTDLGRGQITQNASDNGKFRVPNLRNITITYPYMHDGRFFTLAQVVDHYSNGIKQSTTVDPIFQNTTGFNFSPTEKLDLIAFLKTLTDNTYLANPLYQK